LASSNHSENSLVIPVAASQGARFILRQPSLWRLLAHAQLSMLSVTIALLESFCSIEDYLSSDLMVLVSMEWNFLGCELLLDFILYLTVLLLFSYLKVLPCDSQVVLLAALYSDDDTHLIAVLRFVLYL